MQESEIMTEEIKNKITQLDKSIIKFNDNTYEDIINLCFLMSVPVKRANGEADCLCAKLYTDRIVQYVLSEDTDMLMYGVGHLLRKYDYKDEIELIILGDVLHNLSLDYKSFVDLCILCGTDYTDECIPSCGPKTSYKHILSGLEIESIIPLYVPEKEMGQFISEAFKFNEVRQLIFNAPLNETTQDMVLENRIINWDSLRELLNAKCNYRKTTIDNHKVIVQKSQGFQEVIAQDTNVNVNANVNETNVMESNVTEISFKVPKIKLKFKNFMNPFNS